MTTKCAINLSLHLVVMIKRLRHPLIPIIATYGESYEVDDCEKRYPLLFALCESNMKVVGKC